MVLATGVPVPGTALYAQVTMPVVASASSAVLSSSVLPSSAPQEISNCVRPVH